MASPNNATNVNVKPVVRSDSCSLFMNVYCVINNIGFRDDIIFLYLPKMRLYIQVHAKKDNGPKKSLNLADYKKKRGLI